NLINIVVFLRLGLKDGLSVSFFMVSCADLTCILIMIPSDFIYIFAKQVTEKWRVDGEALGLILAYYYAFFYDLSQIITTFIAVQKCCCVALPMRFRNTFTRARTFGMLFALLLAYFFMYLPIMVSQGLRESTDRFKNSTVLVFWASDLWNQIYSARSTIAIILTSACHVTVTVCLCILVSSLNASSRFRKSVSRAASGLIISGPSLPILGIPQQHSHSKISPRFNSLKSLTESPTPKTEFENTKKNTSRKELQTVKSTTLVSVLFILCNTPKLLIFYAVLCEPEFNLAHRFSYTYLTANTFRFTVEAWNASCNMFVYLKFNRRFRASLRSC
ncbi:unnamed protein product, partial [Lymnaea stagnalis]